MAEQDREYDDVENILRDRLGDNAHLLDLYHLGEEMRIFAATPHGGHLVGACQKIMQDAVTRWLDSPGRGAEAEAAHFDARVGLASLAMIEQTIADGELAKEIIISQDQATEESNDE